MINDAMSFVADSVNIDPPPEQRGLHPGQFTIDWARAKVVRKDSMDVVNVPINAENYYAGEFLVDPFNKNLGTFTSAVHQRLVVVLSHGNMRHGAYLSSVIPDSENSSMDADSIGMTVYNGDPDTKFSGVLMYSTVGTNYTLGVERYEGGVLQYESSVWRPSGMDHESYLKDVYYMNWFLGATWLGVRHSNPLTRAYDDEGYYIDGGGIDEVVIHANNTFNQGNDYGGGGYDDLFGTGLGGGMSGGGGQSSHPVTGGGGGPAGGSGPGTGFSVTNAELTTKVVEATENLLQSCGYIEAFNAVGGFKGLTGGVVRDPSMKGSANAQYYAGTNSIHLDAENEAAFESLPLSSGTYEEIIHYLQDMTYKGGVSYGYKLDADSNKVYPKGNANIEFEPKVINDLYRMRDGSEFDPGISSALVDQADEYPSIADSYREFLNNIKNDAYETIGDLNAAYMQQLQNLATIPGLWWIAQGTIDTSLNPALLDLYGAAFASNSEDDCPKLTKPSLSIPSVY